MMTVEMLWSLVLFKASTRKCDYIYPLKLIVMAVLNYSLSILDYFFAIVIYRIVLINIIN